MSGSCVLFSGGLDSAVLLALERQQCAPVWPIHVRSGLAWEDGEADAIRRLLSSPPFAGRIEPLITLGLDMRDVYSAGHWAVQGRPPAYDTPDEDVYLEGRNITLIAKAGVMCERLGVDRLALGPLAGNPFPDATPEFFAAMSRAMSLGLGKPLKIVAPLSTLHKEDVIRKGIELGVPLDLTLSCMNPVDSRPCGHCSKCRERDDAFRLAGLQSPNRQIAES